MADMTDPENMPRSELEREVRRLRYEVECAASVRREHEKAMRRLQRRLAKCEEGNIPDRPRHDEEHDDG